MDSQMHPLLREIEEQEASAPEAVPSPETPDGPVAPEAEVAAPAEESNQPEPEDFIKISRKAIYADLARLSEEDKEFQNNLNSLVGRKARREYKPKIDEMEAELAQFRAQAALAARQVTDPEALKERLLRDPEFRRQYDAPIPDPDALRLQASLERSVDAIFDGVADVLPEDIQSKYREAITSGHYDIQRDVNEQPVLVNGQPLLLTPTEALAQVANAVNRYARWHVGQRAAAAPAPAPAQAVSASVAVAERPVANPALAAVTPDLSPAGGGAGGQRRMSVAEYERLTPPQQIALYPRAEELERALSSGELYRD